MDAQSDRAIRLCVGGTIHVCARSTLLRHSDSFFAKLLGGAVPSQRDESGALFIDRDGSHFRYILNYLRDGTVHLPPDDAQLRQELAHEANFYQLGPLQLQLEREQAPVSAGCGTKVLHVLPSMGSVTNYALSWDANLKTIQQCQLEAQRETDDMVEFVQLSNDCSLSFPLVDREKRDKSSSDKRVIRWFNTRLPLWRRVRELEQEGYRLHHIQSHPDGAGVEYVVLCQERRSGGGEPATRGAVGVGRLQAELAQLRRELAEQEAARRSVEALVQRLSAQAGLGASPAAGSCRASPLLAPAAVDATAAPIVTAQAATPATGAAAAAATAHEAAADAAPLGCRAAPETRAHAHCWDGPGEDLDVGPTRTPALAALASRLEASGDAPCSALAPPEKVADTLASPAVVF